jgi:pimeloyl-ACP methyl ester carboxylesterase
MATNNLEAVNINNSEQWILVRGKNIDAPLIIHVQAGPGFPMIPEAHTMEKRLRLEKDYLVAYWDQRACGKSFNKNADPKTINFSQLTDDLISCTKYLLEKYRKKKAIIAGYSQGATLALMAASKDKTIFDRLFLVGTDIDLPTANKYAIEFALVKATEKNKGILLRQAVDLHSTPVNNARQFSKRAKLLTNLGGIKSGTSYNQLLISTVLNMIYSKAYRLSDIPKTIKGMEFCQDALLPEFNALNLFQRIESIDVPAHFIHGKQDAISPYQTAIKYYEYLRADKKTLTSFDHSAHMPHYDEPEKFAQLLRDTINGSDS